MMDAYEALTIAGFSDEILSPNGNRYVDLGTIPHLTEDVRVGLLSHYPRPYDFNSHITTGIIYPLADACAEPSPADERCKALVDQYKASTWLNMGNEWEYLFWTDETGYEGFLEFMRNKAWLEV